MLPDQRDYAKQLAYGLLYGKGAHALAADMGVDVKQAAKHLESFLKSIPGVVSSQGILHGTSEAKAIFLFARLQGTTL